MKAIEVEKLKIHCDLCHHEFEGDPPDWHNKSCPECGEGVLVSDDDLALWNVTRAMIEAVNNTVGDVPSDTPSVRVSFDTAGLRPNTQVEPGREADSARTQS